MRSQFWVFLFICIAFSLPILAQPGGGGDPGSGDPVPITGIELLLAAGGILGFWKFFSNKKRH